LIDAKSLDVILGRYCKLSPANLQQMIPPESLCFLNASKQKEADPAADPIPIAFYRIV
jgi:hypothetical protein